MTIPTEALHRRVLDRLTSGPLGRKILEEAAQQAARERGALQARLLQVAADYERARPPLVAAVASADEKLAKAKAAYDAAALTRLRAHADLRGLEITHDARKSSLEGQLRASAEGVDEFLGELQERENRIRSAGADRGTASTFDLGAWAPTGSVQHRIGRAGTAVVRWLLRRLVGRGGR